MKLSNYSKIFKALSNEQRLKIFLMIYKQCCTGKQGRVSQFKQDGSSCCPTNGTLQKAFTKICSCMKLSKSTISHHFKELQNAGLINCEREGQNHRCSVNEDVIKSIKDFFG